MQAPHTQWTLRLSGILPTSAFDMSAFLSVYPLTPSTDGQLTSLRLIAPVGFVWIPFAEQGWQGYLPNITCKYCELQVTPEVGLAMAAVGQVFLFVICYLMGVGCNLSMFQRMNQHLPAILVLGYEGFNKLF